MLSFIFKSKPNYINFGLLVYRLALGISMFYHGYLKYLSGAEGLYKVGAMLAPLGVPGGYEILGTMAAYAEMIGGVLMGRTYALFFGKPGNYGNCPFDGNVYFTRRSGDV